MAYRLKPIVKEIMSILRKHGFEIVSMRGDHIKINKNPPLKRPIILVNEKRLSNKVRQNLLREVEECGVQIEELKKLF